MSSFPPARWRTRFLKDMDSFTLVPDDQELSLEALLAVAPAGGEEGAFRFVLSGPDDLRLYTAVNKILDDPVFSGMFLEALVNTNERIQMEKNSVTSKWLDIVDLVASQDVDIVNGEGDSVAEQFLETLATLRKQPSKENTGNCRANLKYK